MENIDLIKIRAIRHGTKSKKESIELLNSRAINAIKTIDGIYIHSNVASSKNSKTIGFYYQGRKKVRTLVDSPSTKVYKSKTKLQYKTLSKKFREESKGKEYPLKVRFTFIRDSLRKFDLINAAQVVQDMMVRYDWIEDDSSDYIIPVFNEHVFYSKEHQGIIIEVL